MAARLSLAQAVDDYLAWLELDRRASPSTVVQYRGDLERFRGFAAGNGVTRVAQLDRDLLRAY